MVVVVAVVSQDFSRLASFPRKERVLVCGDKVFEVWYLVAGGCIYIVERQHIELLGCRDC